MLSAYRRRIVDRRTPQLFRELQLLTFGQLSEFRKLCERHTVEFEVKFVPVNFGLSWLTSKMSHDGTWRASCRITIPIPSFHFESTLHRTRRDKSRRWLWRLVRLFSSGRNERISASAKNVSSDRNVERKPTPVRDRRFDSQIPLAAHQHGSLAEAAEHKPAPSDAASAQDKPDSESGILPRNRPERCHHGYPCDDASEDSER